MIETTCLGAAYAAGLAVGFWPNQKALKANWKKSAEWKPKLDGKTRDKQYRKWKKAVRASMDWVDETD